MLKEMTVTDFKIDSHLAAEDVVFDSYTAEFNV